MNPTTAIAVLDANFIWTRDLFLPLAKQGPVLFLHPGSFLNARRAGWPVSSFFRLRRERDQLYSAVYPFPPGWFSRAPTPFFRWIARDIKRWRQKVGARRLILVATYPQYARTAAWVRPDISVYYWTDEFRVYWASRRPQIVREELRAVSNLDLTLCCSYSKALELQTEVPAARAKIHPFILGFHAPLLPSAPATAPSLPPADLAHLPRPIIGHWGQISRYLDFETLHEVATRLPTASIVLVGPVQDNFEGMERTWFERAMSLPNVHLLGTRPYPRIIEYIPSFDINLVLYRPDFEFTRVLNPSKVREYLAAGRPIVSTPIADIPRVYPGLVHVGATPQAFAAHVTRIVADGCTDGREAARWEWARTHTWETAAKRFWDITNPTNTGVEPT